MKLTTEITANLFHYGQSLMILEILENEIFLEHEKLNFNFFLSQNNLTFETLNEDWLSVYNYGRIIGASSVSGNNSDYYWETINSFREFLISNELDPERVGLRAHEISIFNKNSYENGYN